MKILECCRLAERRLCCSRCQSVDRQQRHSHQSSFRHGACGHHPDIRAQTRHHLSALAGTEFTCFTGTKVHILTCCWVAQSRFLYPFAAAHGPPRTSRLDLAKLAICEHERARFPLFQSVSEQLQVVSKSLNHFSYYELTLYVYRYSFCGPCLGGFNRALMNRALIEPFYTPRRMQ